MVSRWRLLLPGWLRSLPADITAVTVVVFVTVGAISLPIVRETWLRVLIGLPFVLFVPGYAFIAALFPEVGSGPTNDTDDPVVENGGIDGLERVALSFGTSIVIVPLIGLVLNFTPWGIRLVPVVGSVSGFTLIAAAVATYRRNELPPEDRFRVPYREWVDEGRSTLFAPETRLDGALNVLLVASLLLAVGSVGYAVAGPKQGESFSEFYLLTEDQDGDLVADGYPQNFTAEEGQSLYVGIGNHEHRTVNYTVVVLLQEVRFQNNSSKVLRQERLGRFQTVLDSNETWRRNHTVTPTMTGQRLRLTYLLYTAEVPAEPSIENAYREVHLWVNVSESSVAQLRPADVAREPALDRGANARSRPQRVARPQLPANG
jgi:uncharacterized membrane protein